MKITKTELKQIIKEELGKMMEGNFQEEYCKQNPEAEGCREYFERLDAEDEARDIGIPEEEIEVMDDDQLIAAIHAALDNAPPRVY